MTRRGKGPTDEKPRDVGDDQEAGYQAGEDFAPRNRGAVEDAVDRAAAEESARLAREAREDADVSTTPISQTPWEARVERGEEWTEERVPEREARGEEEPNSETSRRGLLNPPPEE